MTGVQSLPVSADDADIRLDRWFKRHFPGLKHGRLEKLLRTGQVRVDGGRVKASTRLAAGQMVRVPPLDTQASQSRPKKTDHLRDSDVEWINSLVLHSDSDLFVLNKPSGIAVQGGSGVGRHIDGLLAGLVAPGAERPKLVHRLDRDTSGVLLVARNARVANALGEVFRSRAAVKTYWALVSGVPSPRQGTVDAALLKSAGRDGYEKVAVDPEKGKQAITEYRVVENAGSRVAWLSLRPQTGRTHQLRVHCAILGTPIVGDRKYGAADSRIEGLPGTGRLHLHARSISLPHPEGGTLTVTAPLSKTMSDSWEFFGFDNERE